MLMNNDAQSKYHIDRLHSDKITERWVFNYVAPASHPVRSPPVQIPPSVYTVFPPSSISLPAMDVNFPNLVI